MLLYIFSTILAIGVKASLDEFTGIKYIGCFSSKYAKTRDLGQAFYPFSWESCVLLCQSKGSRYAGLAQRKVEEFSGMRPAQLDLKTPPEVPWLVNHLQWDCSETRKRTCYCGSYLVENSKKFPPSDCPYSCKGIRRKSCGGDGSLTVYKLKDDDLPRVVVAHSNTISYLNNKQLVPLITLMTKTYRFRIRCHYKYNELYFNANGDIVRSQYSTTTNSYNNAPSIVVSAVGKNRPFVVDWVSDKLYFVKGDNIWEANLNGTDQRIVKQITGSKVLQMEMDPYEKTLFYNFGCKLNAYNLRNKVETSLLQSTRLENLPVAYDVHTQSVYGIMGEAIMKKGPNDAAFQTTNFLPSLGGVYYVEVVDDKILMYTQQTATKLYVHYRDGSVNILLPDTNSAGSVAMHELIQAPTKMAACHKMRCSHECEYSPQSFARCVCPNNMQLDSTGLRCRVVKRPRYISEESDCGSYSDCSATISSDGYTSDSYSDSESRYAEDTSDSYSDSESRYAEDTSDSFEEEGEEGDVSGHTKDNNYDEVEEGVLIPLLKPTKKKRKPRS